jgi:hypothetical protein
MVSRARSRLHNFSLIVDLKVKISIDLHLILELMALCVRLLYVYTFLLSCRYLSSPFGSKLFSQAND